MPTAIYPESRDLNHEDPTFGPFRFPDTDWKKLVICLLRVIMGRIGATDDTLLLSQGYSGAWWCATSLLSDDRHRKHSLCGLGLSRQLAWPRQLRAGRFRRTICRSAITVL